MHFRSIHNNKYKLHRILHYDKIQCRVNTTIIIELLELLLNKTTETHNGQIRYL